MAALPIFATIAALLLGALDPRPSFDAAVALGNLGARPAPSLVSEARRCLDAHDYDCAAALAALATLRAVDDPEAPLVVGLARFRAGQPELAVAPFVRAVERAPGSA